MRLNAYTLAAASAVLAAAVGLAGCNNSKANGGGGDDDVAASVNGVDIPVSKIDKQIDLQLTDANGNKPTLQPAELAAARMQALQSLIQEEALFQRAQKESVVPTDDELKQALQQEKQDKGMTEEQFQSFLKQVGMTSEEFTQDARRKLAIKKLQDKVAAQVQTPSEEELKKLFDDNKAQIVAPRGLQLSDIVVDPNSNGLSDDAVTSDQALKKAQDIYSSLKSGLDFATVARARSEDRSAAQGGSLGFLSEAQLRQTFPNEIIARFFAMQPGQYTEPIPGGEGRLHIFKLDGKREQNEPLTYDQAKQTIAQQVVDQRKQLVISALYVDALSSASVKNYVAERILQHPDTFGILRPSPLTQPRAQQAPAQPSGAPAQPPAPAQPAQPATNAAKPADQPAKK